MAKYLVSFLVLTLGLGAAVPAGAFAQTPTAQAQLDLINQLSKQIQDLQAQILVLQKKSVELQVQRAEEVTSLIKTLRQGSSGDDVKVLQALLAADLDIYPEGLITGYYGLLTAKAVRKFQAKHGFEQVGIVGPKTLKKLNEILKENRLALEDDDDGDDDDDDNTTSTDRGRGRGRDHRPCAIVPPGHLIAKGWLKKNEKPIVPLCQKLPPGIDKRIDDDDDDDGNTTSTPDTTAPVITNITAVSTVAGATITWTTNENSDSEVYYSTSAPLNKSTAAKVQNNSLATNHSLNLAGLSASTIYYYIVESKDAAGNEASGAEKSFSTASPDTAAPTISSVAATNVSSTAATITWITNEPATSKVYYATSTPVNLASTFSVSESSIVTNHSLNLTNLNLSTTYYFIVESSDAAGNRTTSIENVFVTTALDTTAPVISNVTVSNLSSTSATITWTTNENSTSRVYYSTSTPTNFSTALTAEVSGLVTAHSVPLSGLNASTTYYFAVESKDAPNNIAASSQSSLTTP